MPGASADSIVSPGSTSPSRRATISISGSSGIRSTLESRRTWIPGCSSRRRRSRAAPSASSRRSSPSPRRRATCTAPRSAPRSAPRCCPPRRRWSGPPCSSPGHAPDLLARLRGTGHAPDPAARPRRHRRRPRAPQAAHARRRADLLGSGTVDMKGGVVLALGALRALAERPRATSPRPRCCSSATRSGARRRSATSSASPAGTRACASRPAS